MPRRLFPTSRPLRALLALLGLLLVLWFIALPLAVEPLLRWGLGRSESGLAGHTLRFQAARFSPWRVALEVEQLQLQSPQGERLAAVQRLRLDINLLGALRHRATALDLLRLEGPQLRLLLLPQGRSNWGALLAALQAQPAAPDATPPRLRIALLQVEQGRFDYEDRRAQVLRTDTLDRLQLELRDLSTLPEERGAHQLVARSGLGGELRWRGEFGLQPLRAQGQIQLDGLQLTKLWALLPNPPLAVQPPGGQVALSLRYEAQSDPGQAPQLKVDGLRLQLDGLRLQGLQAAEPALELPRLLLEGGRLDLRQRRLQLAALRLQGGKLQLARDAAGRFDVEAWLPATPADPNPGPRWQLALGALDLQGLALRLDEAGFQQPQRIELDALSLQLAAEAAWGGTEAPALKLQDLQLQAQGLRAGDWLRLPQASLNGGMLDLAARQLELGPLQLQGAALQLQRDATGGLPLLTALQRREAAPAAAGPSWQTRIAPLTLTDAQLQLDDAGLQPPQRWALRLPQARLEGLGAAALQLQAEAELASGGRLRAQGQLLPQLDLQLGLQQLVLAPLQPYLAAYTPLKLAGGRLDVQGRLRQAPAWQFTGQATLAALRVDEPGVLNEPFLAWRRLQAPRLRLSPTLLDLGRLQIDGLQAKLLIDAQKNVNWDGLWQTPPSSAAPTTTPATTPTPRLRLQHLRLREARVDFADLSLALPFAVRIHQGEGELAGLDTAPGSGPAELRFDGQVDDYGQAQASGRLQALDPTGFSDLQLRFRNIEMTRLTPYTATFAGRRIASGKLDLDLDYQLRARQLQGHNRIVMQSLVLGERIESPSATSLPLDLAIALLEDSEGRIDLGLPVSGSLDEPKFSYGGLIWKVITNVLGKIVSAPFRALGALFGGEKELSDRIGFPAGSAQLAPPEREKLLQLAQALAKRPGLQLLVSAGYTPERDAPVLKARQLREELAQIEGHRLEAEDALLLPAQSAKALRQLYARRFSAAELERLEERHALAQPAPPPNMAQRLLARAQAALGRAPAPLSEAERTELAGRPLPELLWQRLLAAEPLAPQALEQLGQARAAAMADWLRAQGLQRLRVEAPAALPADGVELPLQVEVLPKQ
ncbi:DUF748 domain-containing protein [Inhella sp.]|uniref:DUF748 domain-containing protein n=1 Tax=Inhella sp. TaxID=1921806 RepID=UPI0035AE7C43